MPSAANSSSIFYGYPPELIARWCGVSVKTATLYKAGLRKPSRPALKLFALYRDGRVLGAEWRDWQVVRDQLVDPEGAPLSQGVLRGYGTILQWVSAVAAKDPTDQAQYYQLLEIPQKLEATRQPVSRRAPRHRGVEPLPNPFEFTAPEEWQRRAMDGPPQKETGTSRGPRGRLPSGLRAGAATAAAGGRETPPLSLEEVTHLDHLTVSAKQVVDPPSGGSENRQLGRFAQDASHWQRRKRAR